jgi:hypothetical protein
MTNRNQMLISEQSTFAKMLSAIVCLWIVSVSAEAQSPSQNSYDVLPPADSPNTESDSNKIAFKLTPSWYRSDDGARAGDINLRANTETQTAWLGYYRDKASFAQTRGGYENKLDGGWLRTVLSAQVASGGFVGGSITSEIGGETYGIIGFGRTNLRDYYNLNFDPNDAITIGAGTRALADTELTLFHLWDDRLHTRQRVTHAIIRQKFANKQRLTLDISRKSGLTTDDNFVRGYAATLTYDFRQYFLRVARDEYVNFSPTAQYRVSLGARF